MKILEQRTIFSGQHVVTAVPSTISTILGSCVSVCLWDRQQKLAGMNHYLLPGFTNNASERDVYGMNAIQLLIDQMLGNHARIHDIEAKIFGGSNSLYKGSHFFNIGEKNTAIAHQILKENNIAVVASHVGGRFGRKILFNTLTGKVRVQLLVDAAHHDHEVTMVL